MVKQFARIVLLLALTVSGTRAAPPQTFNNFPYAIGMNGGNPGASQWFQLKITVSPDGTVLIHQDLTNDVFGQAWCGTYRLQLFELGPHGPGTGPLLLDATSAGYCINSKGLDGHENRADKGWWEIHMSPEAAERFIAHPDVRGVRAQYRTADSITDFLFQIAQIAAQVLLAN